MENVTAAEANHRCQLVGAHLTSVHSDEENAFLQAHVLATVPRPPWIGLMKTQQGGFSWMDGSSSGYFNWEVGEPNDINNGEDCVEMYVSNGKWNDKNCETRNGYICRRLQDFGSGGSSAQPTNLPTATVGSTVSGATPPPSTSTTSFPSGGPTPPTTLQATIPYITPTPGVKSQSLTSGGLVGVIFACLIIAMLLTFGALLYLKRRGTLQAYESNTFDNPTYSSCSSKPGTSRHEENPVYSSSQGMVSFGTESHA